MHIPFVVNDLAVWRDVGELAGQWTAIDGNWDWNGKGMMGDACIVRFEGD
jgi:hypothetical protein